MFPSYYLHSVFTKYNSALPVARWQGICNKHTDLWLDIVHTVYLCVFKWRKSVRKVVIDVPPRTRINDIRQLVMSLLNRYESQNWKINEVLKLQKKHSLLSWNAFLKLLRCRTVVEKSPIKSKNTLPCQCYDIVITVIDVCDVIIDTFVLMFTLPSTFF